MENVCLAHLKWGMDVAQTLPAMFQQLGTWETSALGLVQRWRQWSIQNPTDKSVDQEKTQFILQLQPQEQFSFGKVWMYFLSPAWWDLLH